MRIDCAKSPDVLAIRPKAILTLALACLLSGALLSTVSAQDDPPWTRSAAVAYALEHNPELMAARHQRGIAAAGVVIARTYPFNPVWDFKGQQASGPRSAGITSVIGIESAVHIDIELRHQGTYRRQQADAALSHAEWDVATLEVNLAIRAAKAFDALIHRQGKLALAEAVARLKEQVAERAAAGKAKRADDLAARADVYDARGQVALARTVVAAARADLARALGTVGDPLIVAGALEVVSAVDNASTLGEAALNTRPERRSRQAALAEADAKVRLEVANRWGNPTFGPDYEYDPTRVNFAGFAFSVPLNVINSHKGDVLQRRCERAKALADLQQVEVQIRQDVEAALARLDAALDWEAGYRTRLLPDLRGYVEEIERQTGKEASDADLAQLADFRQRLLKARMDYLDALWEVSQARADLAAAVGDPCVMVGR